MSLPNQLADRFALDGRCVLVTGASSGIGRHAAQVFAEAGAIVVLAARRYQRIESLADHIRKDGGTAFSIQLDVIDNTNLEKKLDEIESAVGSIDVLFNNAGRTLSKPMLEQSFSDWRKVMDVNLDGAWSLAKAVAVRMSRRSDMASSGGSIINVTSIAALRVLPNVPAYVASKAALRHLTKAMAVELAPFNIRVNSLVPGYFVTELSEKFLESERGKATVSRVPIGRVGSLRELDGVLLLLASEMSSYITGTEIVVDGGMVATP